MAHTNKPQGTKTPIAAQAAAAKLAQENARMTAAGSDKPQATKTPLAAQAAAAKLARENARMTAAGTAAGSDKPQSAKTHWLPNPRPRSSRRRTRA
jgi:hypothetical protein